MLIALSLACVFVVGVLVGVAWSRHKASGSSSAGPSGASSTVGGGGGPLEP